MRLLHLIPLLLFMPAAAFSGCAVAQTYPNKPLRILTAEAGGGSDFAARIVGQVLSERLDQQAIVDNRGNLAIDIAAKAPPDGYTLLLYGTVAWLAPLMRQTSWDPIKDFMPVSTVVNAPNVIVTNPSFPANSVKDLIALAKAKPGQLNYASGGSGSTSHLAAELFKSMANVDIVRIAYRGIGPAVNVLLSGEVPLMFRTAATIASQVKSGKLKALALTSIQPSTLFPGIPTVNASGLPGYQFTSMSGILVPARTDRNIVATLNREVLYVLARADVKEKFLKINVEAEGSSPQQFGSFIKAEMVRMGKVIKDAGIRED